jgi:hypothetical protein
VGWLRTLNGLPGGRPGMSRQNDVSDPMWSDPPFHALSPHGKLMYVWSFTNSRVGMAGIYKIPQSTIEHELGLAADQVALALEELQAAGFLFYDGTWLWVRSRIKRLRTRTVQMCRSIAKQVAEVPADHPFRVALLHQDGDGFWASTDVRATICQELGGMRVPSGSAPGFTAPRRNSGYHRRTTKVVQGQGQGKGQGPSREGVQGEGFDGAAWARQNLPDLPEDLVGMTAAKFHNGRYEITAEFVRGHVLAANPHLAEEAA